MAGAVGELDVGDRGGAREVGDVGEVPRSEMPTPEPPAQSVSCHTRRRRRARPCRIKEGRQTRGQIRSSDSANFLTHLCSSRVSLPGYGQTRQTALAQPSGMSLS